MSSIVKTVLTLSAGIGLASSAVIVKNHPIASASIPQVYHSQSISPIIIDQDGKVRFLGRIPPLGVAAEIRLAAQSQDFDRLNEQLIKYNFYVIPETISSAKNL